VQFGQRQIQYGKISQFAPIVHGRTQHCCPKRAEQLKPTKQAECCGSGPGYTNTVGNALPIVKTLTRFYVALALDNWIQCIVGANCTKIRPQTDIEVVVDTTKRHKFGIWATFVSKKVVGAFPRALGLRHFIFFQFFFCSCRRHRIAFFKCLDFTYCFLWRRKFDS
jgi:hypothetical protein